MPEKYITISHKLKPIKPGSDRYHQVGYEVAIQGSGRGARNVEFHKRYQDALWHAVFWSFRHDDAPIIEFDRTIGNEPKKYRASDLPEDDPIRRKVFDGGCPPPRG